jgi:RNA polymerase sigma-70 factor (ECF subfamily)
VLDSIYQEVAAHAHDRAPEQAMTRAPETEADFEATFKSHYARVYGLIFRLVGNQAEAEDLTLETFWKLWEQGKQQRSPCENLGGWLYRVATRLGYNALRSARRRSFYEQASWQDRDAGAQAVDPAQSAERGAARVHVQRVLQSMRPRDAQLLILRHSGLSYKEIAAVLKVSPNSVGALLARAEKEFEQLYATTDEASDDTSR